jgi:hypothetical protein
MEKWKKYLFLLLFVLIWKILYFSAEIKFSSMILMFVNISEKQGQNLSLASLYRVNIFLGHQKNINLVTPSLAAGVQKLDRSAGGAGKI